MGKLSHGQKLAKSIKIVESVFRESKRTHLSFHTKKKGMEDSTYDTYREKALAVIRAVFEKHHEADIYKMTPDQVADVFRSMKNTHSAKGAIHAMSFLQRALDHSNLLRKPTLMQRDESGNLQLLNEFQREKRYRHAEETTVMKATLEQVHTVIRTVEASRAANKSQTVTELKLELMVGTRVEEALAVRARDITIWPDGTAQVHIGHKHAKGGRSRDVDVRDKSAVEFLLQLKERALRPDAFVIPQLRKRNGDILGIDDMKGRIQKTIYTAARRSGVREAKEVNGKQIPQFFSTHSARKAFVRSMIAEYKLWSDEQLKAEIDRRIVKNLETKQRDNTYSDYRVKWNTLRHRINFGTKGKQRTHEWREPNHKELVFYLASLDIGHARLDVLRFYADYED